MKLLLLFFTHFVVRFRQTLRRLRLYPRGFFGRSTLDTGYVFAPYVPIYRIPTSLVDDFKIRKGFTTRYAKTVVNPAFFGKINIKDL